MDSTNNKTMSMENNSDSKIPSQTMLLTKADSGNCNQKNSSSIENASYFSHLSSYQIFNEDDIHGKELGSDSRLTNWDKWLNIHRKQQDKLSNSLKRPANCLVMNMNFHNLYVNQQKQLISEASDYELCDKYRGFTGFWNSDNNFKNRGKPLGVYQPIQKKYDRSRLTTQMNWCPPPKELEYVDVPDVIYRTKGLSDEPCSALPKTNWDKSQYVFKRQELLRDKISLFQEHKPQAEELAIVGVRFRESSYEQMGNEEELFPYDNEKSNQFTISDEQTVCSITSKDFETSIISSVSVSLDNEIIESHLKQWDIFFDDCIVNEIYKKCLTIKNLDDCCLRCSWESIPPPWVASALPLKQLISNGKYFYFNRNPAVILPKSNAEINFYFEPDTAGVFCEKWNLFVSNAPDKREPITLTIQAVASERSEYTENLKIIESYIESCTRFTVAKKSVQEVIERVRPERIAELPYEWKFLEEQVFIFNNPDLFYNSKYVLLLKEMFKKIGEGPWDYSVESLRKRLSQKSFDEDMTTQIRDYTSIICHLAKPKMTLSMVNEIYKSVYALLCYLANRIEEEGNNLKYIFRIPKGILSFQMDQSVIKCSRSTLARGKSSRISMKSNTGITKTLIKTKSSFDVSSLNEKIQQDSSRTSWISDIAGNSHDSEFQIKMKKQDYLDALYIKTYHYLCKTVDNISAVIDSYDAQKKKSAFKSLKNNMPP